MCSAACTTRSSTGASERAVAEDSREHAGVPIYNGLTDEWHPTQMLADFLRSGSTSPKPLSEVIFGDLGDARFNMADSYLVGGAKLGMDVRIAAPKSLWPRDEIIGLARSSRRRRGRDHDHRRRRGGGQGRRRASDRRVGLDGRGGRGLGRSGSSFDAVPGQHRDDDADGQPGSEVHALPAGVPQHGHARSARRSSRSSAWTRSK